MTSGRVCVGVIGGAFGVRGEARIGSFTDDPEAIFAYAPLTDASGARTFRLTRVGAHKDGFRARIEGVATREDVERLRNTRLFVARDALPPPDDADEFYHADLIGLRVEDATGAHVASVQALADFGAGDLIEIALEGSGRTVFLPFTRDIVPTVDVAGGRIVIVAPEGLLDTDGAADDDEAGP